MRTKISLFLLVLVVMDAAIAASGFISWSSKRPRDLLPTLPTKMSGDGLHPLDVADGPLDSSEDSEKDDSGEEASSKVIPTLGSNKDGPADKQQIEQRSVSGRNRRPLLGEISVDGSLVVLVPAAVIAVLGAVTTTMIALEATDPVVSQTNEVTTVNQNKSTENGCRGICSSQEDDVDGLRVYMESLRGKKDSINTEDGSNET